MNRDERRQAIEGPIGVGGARISPRLVQRLLNDVGEDPDQLPVLQHALMRTWQHWERQRGERPMLDLDDYEAIGTMSEALSRDADEAHAEIGSERGRGIAEMLFKRLTERGKDARETRRPTRFDELCAVAGASPVEVTRVIDRFRDPARSFLMPAFDVPLRDDSIVDISHESLIRKWKRLDKWVTEEVESRAMYQRIADAAERFRSGKGGLWGNPDLKLALDWFDRAKPNAAWATRYGDGFAAVDTFLQASKRKALIRRGIVPLIFVLALIAGYAVLDNQRTREENERAKAETNRLKAIERIVLEGLTYQLPQSPHKTPEVLELERQIYTQNIETLQKMIAQVGADQASVRETAVNWLKLSDVLLAQNDLPSAHDAVGRAEPLIRTVIASAPSDPNWQRDLSTYHQQMGDVLVAQNDLPGALREYRADLDIVRALLAAAPTSVQLQRDASVAHTKLGDLLLLQGDAAGALAEYRLDLEIAERLAHADPAKASLQSDLATSHERIADALTRVGKATEAGEHIQSAQKIRETLARR
jgi:tetratricopeptide (TPR) repeat protein